MVIQPTLFGVTTALGQAATIALTGEFDMYGEADATLALETVLAEEPESVIVDLSGLTFMDSSGIRWLVMTRRRCLAEGRRLLIVPGVQAVHRVFTLCGLEQFFELAGDARESEAA
jgi:anti-sigma B factor antagonist